MMAPSRRRRRRRRSHGHNHPLPSHLSRTSAAQATTPRGASCPTVATATRSHQCIPILTAERHSSRRHTCPTLDPPATTPTHRQEHSPRTLLRRLRPTGHTAPSRQASMVTHLRQPASNPRLRLDRPRASLLRLRDRTPRLRDSIPKLRSRIPNPRHRTAMHPRRPGRSAHTLTLRAIRIRISISTPCLRICPLLRRGHRLQ